MRQSDNSDAADGKRDTHASTTADRKALIDGLNHDLAGEYQAVLMYVHYSAKLTGPYRRQLRSLFQAEIRDELGHAQFLSDKIVALGGEPTAQPRPVPDAQRPREMLERALAAEKQAIADYSARRLQAAACGELGLKVVLENQIADETRHKEEIERILAGWKEVNREQDRQGNLVQDDRQSDFEIGDQSLGSMDGHEEDRRFVN
jgi:bacterioferritin